MTPNPFDSVSFADNSVYDYLRSGGKITVCPTRRAKGATSDLHWRTAQRDLLASLNVRSTGAL